ncbi:MAG: glutamine-hydrolyzing carbamoyl-phosphate synthase small subunit [Acidobacteria bacterium]|nr:glutamine-hydrolyzing carbamoyl-phosphate synthase small subunit [Acidobacteriota bacterium]
MNLSAKAILVLEDGRTFQGFSFGAEGEVFGEMVFNTSMTGYQEILTDPSYAGQIVCMTYPLIGNYGVNENDTESRRPWVEGFVVKESSGISSNWRSSETLEAYLKRYKIVGIEHIDTRALVRHIRDKGAMRAAISTVELDKKVLLDRILESPVMNDRELASTVTTDSVFEISAEAEEKFHVVCYDFGVKNNSLRNFSKLGCRITVVPSDTSAADVMALGPDGIFLSNGPGDPAAMKNVVREIAVLANNRIPMFGICLGHQLLARAVDIPTYKMHHGHRGINHPVKNLITGHCEITSQNHGFGVSPDAIRANDEKVEITHLNLNDDTIEGIRIKGKPAFSVQYHPEASPGPHDARYLFDEFIRLMAAN